MFYFGTMFPNTALIYGCVLIISAAIFCEICITYSAPKPINKLTAAKPATGRINTIFFCLGKVSNSSPFSTSPFGKSFQNTSSQIFAIRYKVIKLANIKAKIRIKDFAVSAAWNKLILGQNPDRGGIPARENKTMANRTDHLWIIFIKSTQSP